MTLKPSEAVSIRRYDFSLEGIVPRQGPNYTERAVHFTVSRGGEVETVAEPAKRKFTVRGSETTEAAIKTFWFSQLYVSIGDIAEDGAVTVRIYWKSLVTLTWLGAVVMAFGGLLSLSDRRLRVGAPRPARQVAAAPAE